MERTFTNQQGERRFICGEIVANGEESTWDRSPKKLRQVPSDMPGFAQSGGAQWQGAGYWRD